jgi:alpha-L-rhamnosidase
MKPLFWLSASFCLGLLVSCSSKQSALSVGVLKCENRVNPAGVSVSRPFFSWELSSPERGQRQTAFQVQVAGSPDLLRDGRTDLWDSGKRRSSDNLFIRYEGKEFAPGTEFFWHVRVWDREGRVERDRLVRDGTSWSA